MSKKIEPFLPVYTRPPNTFLYYKEERFDDGAGHTGIVRTAYFLTKKKEEQTMNAQVIWD
jgi:hypothetical protein